MDKSDKRVARTIDLYKEYSAAVRKDALDLDLKWAKFATGHPALFEKKVDEQVELVNSFFGNEECQRFLVNISSFYDTLQICVENRACDRNTAIDLFGPMGRSVFEISGHYIMATRQTHRSGAFGRGLEEFYRLRKENIVQRYIG
jgi:hypothetical protein